jgi:hypothetical protein
MTGYRHFHLKKGKVKQGFIYENAQKKVLGKSLILFNQKVYEPCIRKKFMSCSRIINFPYS